jgi:hypothetical protein
MSLRPSGRAAAALEVVHAAFMVVPLTRPRR